MNFLAHLFLSCQSEDLIIGNMIADFIRNKEVAGYSEGVQQGIFLHRSIDHFTDNHAMVRQGTQRLRPIHGKYSPVVIDIFYDYCLAKNWATYSPQKFPEFREWIYDILRKRKNDLPDRLEKRISRWIEGDWLQGYSTKEGLHFVFKQMDKRTKFPSAFAKSVDHLHENFELYNKEFNLFFPEVIQMVDEKCNC